MQLELSSEGRYALRALVYLARAGERVTADRISTEARAAYWPASWLGSPMPGWWRANKVAVGGPGWRVLRAR